MATKLAKYIFITGGVVSGLGKGITAASLGRLLINRGLKVTILKLDPYMNVDPGTMNPYEHGETFVTDDGAETDLDIGHYERFLGRSFLKNCNYTSGKIYSSVINKEREGVYLGKTVQVVPHITNEIKDVLRQVGNGEDVAIVEVGGTVGDIEGMVYLEAIRQFRRELGANNSVSIHVTLVPYLNASGEIKTKPTQNSVRDLSQAGIAADFIVCRTNADVELDNSTKEKLAMFCSLDSKDYVIHNKDCKTIYQVPLMLNGQNFDNLVLNKLNIKTKKGDLTAWRKMVDSINLEHKEQKTVAIVGKYVEVPDSYISVIESIKHASVACNVGVNIKLISCEDVEKQGAEKLLNCVDAIVVPGGFGARGIEGKIATAKYARQNNIPYLGLCLGMQTAVIEFARNVLGLSKANSTEFENNTPHPVIDLIQNQKDTDKKGGTMRLGLYDCTLKTGTKAATLYGKQNIKERHRHRYEFNNQYKEQLTNAGLICSGVNEQNNLVEIIELKDHPYFVASQFHPELLSRPYNPHPLFVGLIKTIK